MIVTIIYQIFPIKEKNFILVEFLNIFTFFNLKKEIRLSLSTFIYAHTSKQFVFNLPDRNNLKE